MKLEKILPAAREGQRIKFRNGEYGDLYEILSYLKLTDIIDGDFDLEPRRIEFVGWAASPEIDLDENGDEFELDGVRFYDCDPNEKIPREGKFKVTMEEIL